MNHRLKIIAVVAVSGFAAAAAYTASAANGSSDVAPIRNIAHVYTVTGTGGAGDQVFTIPAPPPGLFLASFSANFVSEGTPSSPEVFSCLLVKNGTKNLAQSTSAGTNSSDSGWYYGVNGVTTVKVTSNDYLEMDCGIFGSNGAWSWGDRPLQVTLTAIDGATYQPFGTIARHLHPTAGGGR